jgi:hypothetical protein
MDEQTIGYMKAVKGTLTGDKTPTDQNSDFSDLLPLLEYHEAAASDGRKDYAAMCEDGDDTYLCGILLSLAEQHEKFAAALRRAIEAG